MEINCIFSLFVQWHVVVFLCSIFVCMCDTFSKKEVNYHFNVCICM